jgi:hypothetical protein
MQVLKTFEQTWQFKPGDPNQYQREAYVGVPGGYGSFYFDRVPNTATLGNVRGLGFWSSIPSLGQAAIVAVLATAAGYLGMKHLGPTVKQKFGLSGARRRRR